MAKSSAVAQTLTVQLARAIPDDVDVVAIPVLPGLRLPAGTIVDIDLDFLAAQGFEGKSGQAQAVPGDGGATVVAIGLGEASELTYETFRKAGAGVTRAAWRAPRAATTILDAVPEGMDRATAARAVAEGARLAAYQYSTYKSESKPCRLEQLSVVGLGGAKVQQGLERGVRIAEAVCLARDLVNEPAASLTPTRLAEIATDVAERAGLQVQVLDQKAIVREGLGGLAGVAAGSQQPPRLIRLTYDPPGRPRATVALVGKGITFDSGGLSIKTADGMTTMKTDKSGACAVLAAMSALAELGTKVRVIGFMPTTENMPSGTAIRPGDVLRIRNGKTVEVLNTDAEGRLVLADGLSLAAEERPDAIVDVATLTGAQVVALGRRIAGLMGNHPGFVEQVRAAGERAGEPSWPLPLPKEYRSHLDSEVADLKNIGKAGEAGTLVAGLFLQEFVDGLPWAHLDIAGPARAESDDGYVSKGGTGFGVRTLLELLTTFRKP